MTRKLEEIYFVLKKEDINKLSEEDIKKLDEIEEKIDDVATSGGSIVSAVQAIRDVGDICNNCVVVVDRQEGAKENCSNNGINLYSLLKKSDFGITKEI